MLRGVCFVGVLAGCDVPFGITHFADATPDSPPDALTSYEAAVLADQPLAYYRLDEALGVTVANRVANGPPGQILGNVVLGQPGAIAGDPDTAYGFDGANSAVVVGDVFGFEGTAPFSAECWARPDVFDGHFHELVTKWQSPVPYFGWEIFTRDDSVTFSRERSDLMKVELAGISNVLVVGVYTHVVATYDGAMLRLYVNGVDQASAPSTLVLLPKPDDPFTIGAGQNPAVSPFHGVIDEVAIYDHALSPDRVFDHFHIGTTAP